MIRWSHSPSCHANRFTNFAQNWFSSFRVLYITKRSLQNIARFVGRNEDSCGFAHVPLLLVLTVSVVFFALPYQTFVFNGSIIVRFTSDRLTKVSVNSLLVI